MSNFFIINKLNEKIILTYFIRYYLNYWLDWKPNFIHQKSLWK
jgi:hypothetical protein